MVELGFGWWSKNDEERSTGNVTLYEGQAEQICQFDKMSFSLDGSKNSQGGQQAANPDLPEAGVPTNKSSQKCSLMFGITFDNQILPPMAVIQSAVDLPKYQYDYIRNIHNVEGKFDYPEICEHAALIAALEIASVDNEIFYKWLEELIVVLFKDSEDSTGLRVLLKADSGPGRFCERFCSVAKGHDISIFPGLPNGTKLGQEMDQLYTLCKTLMDLNWKILLEARFCVIRQKVKVDVWDLPKIMFGGVVELPNKSEIVLTDAYYCAFACERYRSAR